MMRAHDEAVPGNARSLACEGPHARATSLTSEVSEFLNTTVKLVEELQSTTDTQVPPLTQEEQEARDSLCSAVTALSVQTPSEAHTQQESNSQEKRKDVKDVELEAVPRSVRGNVKLGDLNTLYTQLTEHFSSDGSSAPLSLQKMKKLNMRVSEAAIKTLQHLGLIELDKKGLVSLSLH